MANVKWSSFPDFSAIGGSITAVGLQDGVNVKFPATTFDYFATSETLTTGAAPVDIDPTVFLTKIVSGGTAGTEVVNFPDYTPDQSGKPHLVVFHTQTDPADVIHVTGDTNIIGSPFAGAVIPTDPTLFEASLLAMTAVDQGFVMTWADSAWAVQALVQGATATYPNAGMTQWGLYDAPAALYQDTDGTFNMAMDPTNPQFMLTVVASSNIASPTLIPGGVRHVVVQSTGLGGPGYAILEAPAINAGGLNSVAATGIQHVVRGDLINGSDTILIDPGSNFLNGDGALFTSFPLNGNQLVCHWDNNWIVDTETTQVIPSTPQVRRSVFVTHITTQANNANTTVSIPGGYVILSVAIQNLTANAVTGGVKIGTTSGATDVATAIAVGANAVIGVPDATLLLKMFSITVAQTLFIQPVASWNSANVNFQFVCAKVT